MGIHFRAQAAIQLWDSFLGCPVREKTVRLRLPEGAGAVAKPGAIYVLMGFPGPKGEIFLESPVYESRRLLVDLSEQGELRLERILMLPSPAMPLPPGTTTLEGYAAPNSRVLAAAENPPDAIRLLGEGKAGGQSLFIYNPREDGLEGRLLLLCGKSGPGQLLRVREEREGEILFEPPLSQVCRRAGTVLYPVWEGVCGPDGYFRVPIGGTPGPDCPCRVILRPQKGAEESWTQTLSWGKKNRRE